MKLHMNDILFMLIELVSFTNHIYCILFRFRGVVSEKCLHQWPPMFDVMYSAMLYIWENTVNNKCFKNRGSSLFNLFIPWATIPTHYHVVCFRPIANQAQPNVWFYLSVPGAVLVSNTVSHIWCPTWGLKH